MWAGRIPAGRWIQPGAAETPVCQRFFGGRGRWCYIPSSRICAHFCALDPASITTMPTT